MVCTFVGEGCCPVLTDPMGKLENVLGITKCESLGYMRSNGMLEDGDERFYLTSAYLRRGDFEVAESAVVLLEQFLKEKRRMQMVLGNTSSAERSSIERFIFVYEIFYFWSVWYNVVLPKVVEEEIDSMVLSCQIEYGEEFKDDRVWKMLKSTEVVKEVNILGSVLCLGEMQSLTFNEFADMLKLHIVRGLVYDLDESYPFVAKCHGIDHSSVSECHADS